MVDFPVMRLYDPDLLKTSTGAEDLKWVSAVGGIVLLIVISVGLFLYDVLFR